MRLYLSMLLVSLILMVSLCSCGVHTDVEEPTDEGKYYSLSDTLSTSIYMRTEYPEYDEGVEEIKLFFGREDGKGFKFDERYVVYVYEDGEWKKLAFRSDYTYKMVAYELEPGVSGPSETYLSVKVSDLNVKLKPGRYKVQKEFEDGSAYAEFVIK